MAKSYSEKDIQSFQGLTGIRKRPQMYVGDMDGTGLFTILRECLDNAVDEFLAGRNDYCCAAVDDQTCWIIDNGQGIPVGPLTLEAHGMKIKMPALQAITSELHTGGKFAAEGGAYGDGSRGVHGVGIKATNALSTEFDVWTLRDGKKYHIGYERGVLTTEMEVVKNWPQLPHGLAADKHTGTIIRFVPDKQLFAKGSKLDLAQVHEWAGLAAHMNGGITIDVVGTDGEPTTYHSENGAIDYLNVLVEDLEASALGSPMVFNHKFLDFALAFTDFDGVGLYGYTNGLHNPDGGNHVEQCLRYIGQAVVQYKGARQDFKAADVAEGLIGLINIKIPSPAFSNQIKSKLLDDRVPDLIAQHLAPAIDEFLAGNKGLVKKICDRAANMRKLKDEFKASKTAMKELKGGRGKRNLPSKLLRSTAPASDVELYFVEGDSAAGPCCLARDGRYQEVLPLRGKIMNVYKMPKGKRLWDHEDIMNILQSIGYNPDLEDPIAGLRVGRLIFMGDADVDGRHVNLLNLSLFAKVLPQVFDLGMVYIAKGYEYMIETPAQNYYGDSVTEIKKAAPPHLHSKILHLKGWGEASSTALHEMAFNPATRKLVRITVGKGCINHLHKTMGEDVNVRKELLGVK